MSKNKKPVEPPANQVNAQQPTGSTESKPPYLKNREALTALETELDEMALASLLEMSLFPTHLVFDQLYGSPVRGLFECQYEFDGIVIEMQLTDRSVCQLLASVLTVPCQISAVKIAPHLLELQAGGLSQILTQSCQKAYSLHFLLWFDYLAHWRNIWSETSRETACNQMIAEGRLKRDGDKPDTIYTTLGPSNEEIFSKRRQSLEKIFDEKFSEVWEKGITRYIREDPYFKALSASEQSSATEILQTITDRIEERWEKL